MGLQILETANSHGDILRHSYMPGNGRNAFERKFQAIAEQLEDHSIPYLGFNPTGIVPSRGDFRHTTFDSLVADLNTTVEAFANSANLKSVRLVAHSLGAALALEHMKYNINADRAVLLAPALNQRELNVFWAVKTLVEAKDPTAKVTFDNYQTFIQVVGQAAVDAYFAQEGRMTKTDFINPSYYQSLLHLDMSPLLTDYADDILHIHGDQDKVVPLRSLGGATADQTIIVKGGDHDLERPDMLTQWRDQAVHFLTNN